MTAATTESPLVAALNARKRQVHIFDAPSAIRSDGVVNGAIAVRVPTAAEEVAARLWASKYVASNAGADVEVDQQANTDLETVYIISVSMRLASDPEHRPAFGPPEWLLDRLTSDEVSACLSLIEEARSREGRGTQTINEDLAAELGFALAETEPHEAAEMLAHYSRGELVALCCELSRLWGGLLPAVLAMGDSVVEVDE